MTAPDTDSEVPDADELVLDALEVLVPDKEDADRVPFVACADAMLLLAAADADTAVVAAESVAFREDVGMVPV